MAEPVLEQRIDRLEALVADLVRVTAQTQFEMRAFKDEMRAFKDEMRSFKDEVQFEMRAFRDEMRTFKDEMRDFREESRRERIEMRRQWGELSNRLGTMAEDLVAPSVPRILRTVVGCPEDHVDSLAVRVRRLAPSDRSRSQEFDVVAVCGEYVLINETKSRLAPIDVATFVEELATVRDFFPEYAGKRIIGAIALLYVDESLVRHAQKQGLIVLGFGEDVMDVLNDPGFKPREF